MLAALHAAMLGTLGLKLVADRARLPRAWARTQPYDPSTPLRGRYVRLALEIPLTTGVSARAGVGDRGVRLRAVDGKIVGEVDHTVKSPRVASRPEDSAGAARLAEPLAFFIPEHVPDPSIRPAGEELWAEVTIPGSGPPRPIRLGVMRQGKLTPLHLR